MLQVRSDLDTMLLPLLELLYSAHERTPNQARRTPALCFIFQLHAPALEQGCSARVPCRVPPPAGGERHHRAPDDMSLCGAVCAVRAVRDVPAVPAVQMYMLLIILLMLSQDPAFAQNIHKIRLPAVPFYKERRSATTLGSLLVVLLLR